MVLDQLWQLTLAAILLLGYAILIGYLIDARRKLLSENLKIEELEKRVAALEKK